MASKENSRKRKLNMAASQINEKRSRLPNGSKLLEYVTRGQIKDVIDMLNVILTSSRSFDAAFIKATELGHKRILQKLIETGASVNSKNALGNTPLQIACMHGFIDLVKLLVRNGAEVDCQNKDGQTALMLAVEKAFSLPLLEYLTSDARCANVNTQDCLGRTALMVATKLQDLCAMKLLMAHKDIKLELKDESGKTAFDIAKESGLEELYSTFKECFTRKDPVSPLVLALQKESVALVEAVLSTLSPEEVNTLDASSFSPLMLYLNSKSVNIDIVRKLLTAGANVNIGSGNDNITPLLLACSYGNFEAVKLLVAEGADVNTQTKLKKATPLMCSCEDNKLEVVQFLLKHQADVSLTNSNRETALMVALRHSNKRCAEELIKNGAEINDAVFLLAIKARLHTMLPNIDCTAISKDVKNEGLVLACRENNYELAQILLERGAEVNQAGNNVPLILALKNTELFNLLISFGADVNFKNFRDSFPLIEAVIHDDVLALKNVIKHGADLNARDFEGYTSLMKAAKHEKLNFMNILLDAGADINYVSDYDDITALNSAICGKKIEAVKLLLSRGANVNRRVKSPLVKSLREEQVLMEMLLNHGADPNIQLADGSTVLINALEARCDAEKIKLLLSFGADPNAKNNNGESPIIVAAKCSPIKVIELLLKGGADIKARDKNGSTVLLCALSCTVIVDKIAFLINCGADVNQANHRGQFPLSKAMYCRNLKIVRLLVDNGADVNVQDHKGLTCLMDAAMSGWPKKLQFLIECKANLDIQNNNGSTAIILAATACRPSNLKALIKAGANINIVDSFQRTALTASLHYLYSDPPSYYLSESHTCLRLVLSAGAKPDLRNPIIASLFHKLIVLYDDYELVYSFMKMGDAPPVVSIENLKLVCSFPPYHFYFKCENKTRVTPLMTALFSKKTKLARFFLKYWYLNKEDVVFLNKSILHTQKYLGHLCDNALFGLVRQPLSLKCLSFVAVSTAVGSLSDRESRINSLPVPSVLKTSLLFQVHKLRRNVKAFEKKARV